MSGDYDQTDKVSHGCFLRHCSKGQHLPWTRISGVYPYPPPLNFIIHILVCVFHAYKSVFHLCLYDLFTFVPSEDYYFN